MILLDIKNKRFLEAESKSDTDNFELYELSIKSNNKEKISSISEDELYSRINSNNYYM